MGKKSFFSKNKNKSKKEYESISDDYRLSPEIYDAKYYPYKRGTNCCPEGQICCSRETCFPGRNHSPIRSNSLSPNRNVRNFNSQNKNRKYGVSNRVTRNGVDVIVLSDKHLDIRKSSCSSCSSCNSCSSADSHFTRVELRNDLFTSPLQSTQASFYRESPSNFHQRREIVGDREVHKKSKEVRKKRVRSYAGEVKNIRRGSPGVGNRKQKNHYSPPPPRRARSFSGCSSSTSENYDDSFPDQNYLHNFKQKENTQNLHYTNNNVKGSSRERRRRNDNLTDSGIEQSRKTQSVSSGVGTGSSGGGSTNKSKFAPKDARQVGRTPPKKAPKKESELLNKMVNQTREHRKQIKSLENELERLRVTGDSLASCEVNAKDVDWRPGDVLGEGSFSTVYKGFYCGTEVAVKELKFKLSQDDKNYFRSEAALLQQLHHPRIVLLMGICTTSSRPFMLLEYLSGGTLHTLIHASAMERIDHAIYFIIAKDIAQGMNFLHRHDPQVLHLDLKSMNVLLDSYTRAKIADFGFSILRRSHGASSAMQRGTIRGTPAWMAPELLSKGEVSPKCDVYSYAIILWEMLTAAHPFEGLDVYQIMENLENGSRPALPLAGLSVELRELITSCWAQNPSLRPSFEEVLGALETASLPTSWRNVLHRANIHPSALTDVTTARTVIDLVQRSVEIIETPHADKNRHQYGPQGNPVRDKPFKPNQQTKQTSDSRHKEILPSRTRRTAPSKERISQGRQKVVNHSDGYRRSPSRDRRVLSPHIDSSVVQRGRRNGNHYQGRSRDRRPIKEGSLASRSRRVYEPSRERKRSPHKPNVGHQSRRTKYLESEWEEDNLQRYISRDRRSPSRDPSYQFMAEDTNASEFSWEERQTHSWNSAEGLYQDDYKGSDEPHKQRRRQASPVRIYSHSPTRRPLQKQSSPPHQKRNNYQDRQEVVSRNPAPKRHGASPMRYGAIVVTSEQLMNQKQRLRPVRPSALRDLTHLPQSSLNDLSFILKRAIRERREAVDQDPHSGRDAPRSDIDWSDWYT